MSISIKSDSWHVKDVNGQYRGTAIFSSTLPSEAQQIVTESIAEINAVKATIPQDYTELVDEVDDLSNAISELDDELNESGNVLDLSAYAANNNTKVTDNGDGSYTFGTGDYGTTIWKTKIPLPAGEYTLQAVPQGATNAYIFVSTTTSWNDRFASNPSKENTISFTNPVEQIVYYGIRSNSMPSSTYVLSPELLAPQSKISLTNSRIDKTNEELAELSKYTKSLNLFSIKNAVNGYISNSGSIEPPTRANELTSDFIHADENKKVTAQVWATTEATDPLMILICSYDTNKAFINRQQFMSENGSDYFTVAATIPNNAEYFRSSIRMYKDGKAVISYGEFVADYLPCADDIATEKQVSDLQDDNLLLVSGVENITDNKTFVDFSDGYIPVNTSTVDPTAVLPDGNFKHIVVECSGGDIYYIKGHSGSNTIRGLWTFVDTNGTKLNAGGVAAIDNYVPIVAAEQARWLVVNVDINYTYGLIKNVPLGDRVTVLENMSNSATGLLHPFLRPAMPRIVMHRGDEYQAPENTMPAFILAGKAGVWAIETDVYETTDGYFVLSHDDDVSRMTDGTGKITEMTYAQTQACTIDAGTNIEQYPDLKMPLLEDYLSVCRRYGCIAFVEIKGITNYDKLVETIENAGMSGSVIYTFYANVEEIATMRQLTAAPIALIASTSSMVDSAITIATDYTDMWLSIYTTFITSEVLNEAHANNLPVAGWPFSNAQVAEAKIMLGMDIVVADGFTKLPEA